MAYPKQGTTGLHLRPRKEVVSKLAELAERLKLVTPNALAVHLVEAALEMISDPADAPALPEVISRARRIASATPTPPQHGSADLPILEAIRMQGEQIAQLAASVRAISERESTQKKPHPTAGIARPATRTTA